MCVCAIISSNIALKCSSTTDLHCDDVGGFRQHILENDYIRKR